MLRRPIAEVLSKAAGLIGISCLMVSWNNPLRFFYFSTLETLSIQLVITYMQYVLVKFHGTYLYLLSLGMFFISYRFGIRQARGIRVGCFKPEPSKNQFSLQERVSGPGGGEGHLFWTTYYYQPSGSESNIMSLQLKLYFFHSGVLGEGGRNFPQMSSYMPSGRKI